MRISVNAKLRVVATLLVGAACLGAPTLAFADDGIAAPSADSAIAASDAKADADSKNAADTNDPADTKVEKVDPVVMYRLYNPYTGEHFYTSDSLEREGLAEQGWTNEGFAWRAPGKSDTPVYRLYNSHVSGGDHHYTPSEEERDALVEAGWTSEGIGWYSDDDKTVELYRLYNPNASTGTHHYTTSASERDALLKAGWEDEGTAWFGLQGTPIMGDSQATAELLASYYRKSVGEKTYPSDVYAEKGAETIDEFCKILVEEANAEGVRAEVVFVQAMKETGWLRFGGAVKVEWCNFAGLGAANSNPVDGANRFEDVRTGLRAQVQHLKAYASTDDLVNECVDIRFGLVRRGCAPTLEDLNGRWAVPGNGYGESLSSMIDALLASKK